MTPVRVIVCGSREWSDAAIVRWFLGSRDRHVTTVIHGAARGADRIAGQVARQLGFDVVEFPADWLGKGKAAGHIRNKVMLDEGKPAVVVAFKDGFDFTHQRGGTENMVRIAKEAGVPTYVVSHG